MTYVIKFAAFSYLLSQPTNQSFTNIISLLILILPTGIGNTIISCLQRAIQGIRDKFKDKPVDFVAQEDSPNIINSFFKVTVQLLQGMFKNIPSEVFKDMQLSVNKLKMISDYLRSASTIFDYVMILFQKCIEFVGEKVLKFYGKLPKFMQESSMDTLIDDYVEIKEKGLDIQARNNSFIAKKVISVYQRYCNIKPS